MKDKVSILQRLKNKFNLVSNAFDGNGKQLEKTNKSKKAFVKQDLMNEQNLLSKEDFLTWLKTTYIP